jgi:hypothetical protein
VNLTLTVTVSKPGAISAIKILKVRKAKAPLVTSECQLPSAKAPTRC